MVLYFVSFFDYVLISFHASQACCTLPKRGYCAPSHRGLKVQSLKQEKRETADYQICFIQSVMKLVSLPINIENAKLFKTRSADSMSLDRKTVVE